MRAMVTSDQVTLWLSATDTYRWAHQPSVGWPSSDLSGHRLVLMFDHCGLVDCSVDGFAGGGDVEFSSHELSVMAQHLTAKELQAVYTRRVTRRLREL